MRFLIFLAALLLTSTAVAAPKQAQRIVTLSPHLAELVCTAGACSKLVGSVLHTNFPAEAAARPLVGDALNLNFEVLVSLRPDLILSWDGGTSPATVVRLRELGLRVEPVRISRLRDVAHALIRIGDLAGTQTASRFAANLFFHRLDKLRNAHWKKARLRVLYQIESDPMYTITERSPINEAIKLCGGRNVFAKLPQIAPSVGRESVVASDPDVVVFAQQDDTQKIREFWARWPQARAQQMGTLYAVDADLLARQTPRMLDGVEQLCAVFDQARRQIAAPIAGAAFTFNDPANP